MPGDGTLHKANIEVLKTCPIYNNKAIDISETIIATAADTKKKAVHLF